MLKGRRTKSGRWMAILIAVGALIVFLLWAAVAWATNITVDANCSDWDSGDYLHDDGDEGAIPDKYDMRGIYATVNISGAQHFVAYTTTVNIQINSTTATNVWYDIDHNPSTGYPVGPIGADRQVAWRMDNDSCELSEWDAGNSEWDLLATDCDGAPSGIGTKGTCVEVGADGADLGLDGSDLVPICILFENADFAGYQDDTTCFDYDVPSAVELSSFTACSERGRPNGPWFTWLWPVGLVSGVVALFAGGLVLWRRKEPAR